jgi:hypothetical protein
MQDAAASASLQEAGASGWFGSLACGACAQGIDREQPVLYEYLLHGVVDTVQVPAGGWIEPQLGLWPIGRFHVGCYVELIASLGVDDGARYVGCCLLSKRSITSPRPLSHCPMCASPIELVQTQAPVEQAA